MSTTPPPGEFAPIVEALENALLPAVKNNYSPVFHRPIDQHVGIEITGSFRTDDTTTNGEISYITVLRHAPEDLAVGGVSKIVPHDGFGLAWRKQTSSGDDMRYNVYITDNNALQENIFIGSELIVENYGVNNFLVAAKFDIQIDTWYHFKIRINSNMGVLAYLWEDGDVEPGTPTIQLGSTSPTYVPVAAGRHFGLSVPETQGNSWWYRDLEVASILGTYPMHAFRFHMDLNNWNTSDPFTIKYRGFGVGETSTDTGLKLYIKGLDDVDDWDEIGSHTAGVADEKADQELEITLTGITVNDYLEDGFITLLVRPDNDETVHTIRSYYASIETATPSGIHLGNMSDIYYNDPANITEATVEYTATEATFRLENVPGISLPIQEVVEIINSTTGETLVRNTDYHVVVNDTDAAFSTRSNTSITLDGFVIAVALIISYRYSSIGTSIQTLVESDEFRYPNADNLAKIMPPTIITVDQFEYVGGVASEDMQGLFRNYINSGINDSMFEISDLIAIATANGATSVRLTGMDVSYAQYDRLGDRTTASINDSLTISGLTAFYSDLTQLTGVVRI